jgi:hypothetical protein
VLEETVVVAVEVKIMLDGVGEAIVGDDCSDSGFDDDESEVGGGVCVCVRVCVHACAYVKMGQGCYVTLMTSTNILKQNIVLDAGVCCMLEDN